MDFLKPPIGVASFNYAPNVHWVIASGVLAVALLMVVAVLFYPPFVRWFDGLSNPTRKQDERKMEPSEQPVESTFISAVDDGVLFIAIRRVAERLRASVGLGMEVFRIASGRPLFLVVVVIFVVCFAARFFTDARLDRYDTRVWEALLAGIWSGSVAVLMVLGGVVLWRLAHSDRLR
jgi:hypothetical protein